MKYLVAVTTLLSTLSVSAFVPQKAAFGALTPFGSRTGVKMADTETIFDQEQYIAESKEMRLKHLEEQAMFALKIAVENYGMFLGRCPCWIWPGRITRFWISRSQSCAQFALSDVVSYMSPNVGVI